MANSLRTFLTNSFKCWLILKFYSINTKMDHSRKVWLCAIRLLAVNSTSYLIPSSKKSSMLEPIGIVLSHLFRDVLGQALNYAYMWFNIDKVLWACECLLLKLHEHLNETSLVISAFGTNLKLQNTTLNVGWLSWAACQMVSKPANKSVR